MLSWLEAPGITQALQGGQPGNRDDCGLAEVRLAGLRASLSWRARAYSANEPWPMPNTSSPTANPVTSAPAATTVPGHVQSGHRVLGGAQA